MNNIEISKERFLSLLFEGKVVGVGSYGILKEITPTVLVKIYYKQVINTYLSKDSSKLDKEIDDHISALELYNEMQSSTLIAEMERLEQAKLDYLFKTGLLKGVLTYRGYKIGVLLNFYKDHNKLAEVFSTLSNDSLNLVMDRTKEKLDIAMDNGLFPRDIKEDSILVRESDLDVVLIDFDDPETRYEDKDYIKAYPHIKNDCIEKYNQMKERIYAKWSSIHNENNNSKILFR